jgi:hypothetical protein
MKAFVWRGLWRGLDSAVPPKTAQKRRNEPARRRFREDPAAFQIFAPLGHSHFRG